ncbi:hypothetical protein Ddc_17895 [Ditylenchus destructor]|nr:hypothetical protein Ddc_17895 [Ditylenchus destructor]
MSSASTLVLTIERCLLLRFPVQYKAFGLQYFTVVASVFFTIVLFAYLLYTYFYTIPIDVTRVRNCESYSCIISAQLNAFVAYVKTVIGVFNIIIMFYFIYMIRNMSSLQQTDRIAKVTMVMEVAMNTTPILSFQIFAAIMDQDPANYIGQIVPLLFASNIAICSIFYTKTLLRKSGWYIFRRKTIVTSLPSTTMHAR